MSTNVGQYLKFLRLKSGYSQFDIEISTDISPGVLSRIENNKINPTKETIIKIADKLNLSTLEKTKLFNLIATQPTEEEINQAILEVKKHFSTNNLLAYLVDEWSNFYFASSSLIELLKLDLHILNLARGRNMMELIFNPVFGIKQNFHPDYLHNMYAIEIARTRMEVNIEEYYPELIASLMLYDDFKEVWNKSKTISQEVLNVGSRYVHMKINGNSVRFNFAREKLKDNQRFEIVELFNPLIIN
jgi:transcriptional regulator with XRE-family HTH domain